MTALVAQAASALVTLAEVMHGAPEGQEPCPGLPVVLEGASWELVGVGERTATLAPPGGGWEGRMSRRLELLRVDPAAVTWRTKEPGPHNAFVRIQRLDRETKRARAAYMADAMGGKGAEFNRSNPRRPPSTEGDETCSRPDCDNVLHPTNTSGECQTCRGKCPTCGGSKSKVAKTCSSCGSKGGRKPGAITVSDRACAGCGNQLGVAAKGDRCLSCQRICICGATKHEEADRCRDCGHRAVAAERAATALVASAEVPASPDRPLAPPPPDGPPPLPIVYEGGRRVYPFADVSREITRPTAAAGPPQPPETAPELGPEPAVPPDRGGEGEVPVAPEAGTPPAPLALDELPDFVGRLMGQVEWQRGRIGHLEEELKRFRSREAAWRDVEQRVQAVIARYAGRRS